MVVAHAVAATAEPWSCQFTVECIAGEACTDTDWQLDIIAADHEGQLFASSVFGDTPINRLSDPVALPASYASADQLITVGGNGTVTLSTHLDAAINYFGTCEVLQ